VQYSVAVFIIYTTGNNYETTLYYLKPVVVESFVLFELLSSKEIGQHVVDMIIGGGSYGLVSLE